MTMLNVYNLANRRKTAVLQNAFNIFETHELNKIYTLTFDIPKTDEKVQYLEPRHYVRWGDDNELYRIKIPKVEESDTSTISYECEHVITTLCDSIIFGSHSVGGWQMRTRDVIEWLLDQQKVRNWVLDECDFDRRFEYLWEQETIINALYSIPQEFGVPYKWVFDTTVYPWKISLKSINANINPEFYLQAKSNILSSGTSADYANICTRIYPLGYGEGVNQLTIENALVKDGEVDEVNGTKYGKTYIDAPQSYIDRYGIVEKLLVDRRFEHANSLYAYAKTTLEAYMEPGMSRTFDVTDLYPLTKQSWDNAEVGKVCRMMEDGTTAFIKKTIHQLDNPGYLKIDLSTKTDDVSSSVAALSERVRIETVYAQGATQLYQHGKDANATPDKGMHINLYFPSEMRKINKVQLKLQLDKFRSYSQATESAGASTRTSSEGGASTQTSTSGGGSTQTSTSGGGSTQTSTDGGDSTQTSTSGGGSTQTSTSGGGSTQTSTDGGDSTQTSTSGGGSTQTSTSGGATGNTSTNDGGPSMTFTASASDTENANWSTYVSGNGGSSNLDTSSTAVDGTTGEAGKHNHNLWGYTGEVTPAASASYKHNHAINYTGGALENGGHKHSFTSNWHSHSFSVYKLKHTHSVTVTVKNNDTNKSGFAHSHSFSIGSHTHDVTIPSHTHNVTIPKHNHKVTIPNHTHDVTIPSHTHDVTIPKHNHKVTIPNHTHDVTIPSHTHNVTIPNHTHTITIPSHSHSITAGIFESGNPTAFDIYVNGIKKLTVDNTSYNGNITEWIVNGENMVPRESWIDIEIRPNDLAYVISSVFVQGFVQSRGGGTY